MARCLLLGAQRQQSAGMRSCRSCAFPDQRPLAPALLESSRDPFCHSFAQNFAPCGTGAARLPIFGWFFLPEAVFGGGKGAGKRRPHQSFNLFLALFLFSLSKVQPVFWGTSRRRPGPQSAAPGNSWRALLLPVVMSCGGWRPWGSQDAAAPADKPASL